MRSYPIVSDGLFLAGGGCIVWAAFMVYTPLGLLTLGAPLVYAAIQLERKKKKAAT